MFPNNPMPERGTECCGEHDLSFCLKFTYRQASALFCHDRDVLKQVSVQAATAFMYIMHFVACQCCAGRMIADDRQMFATGCFGTGHLKSCQVWFFISAGLLSCLLLTVCEVMLIRLIKIQDSNVRALAS